MKHHRITVEMDPNEVIETLAGKMTCRQWLERERIRVAAAIAAPLVRIETDPATGLVSLWKKGPVRATADPA